MLPNKKMNTAIISTKIAMMNSHTKKSEDLSIVSDITAPIMPRTMVPMNAASDIRNPFSNSFLMILIFMNNLCTIGRPIYYIS